MFGGGGGPPKRVRHNAINVVFSVPVLSEHARETTLAVGDYVGYEVPMRFGFLYHTDMYAMDRHFVRTGYPYTQSRCV